MHIVYGSIRILFLSELTFQGLSNSLLSIAQDIGVADVGRTHKVHGHLNKNLDIQGVHFSHTKSYNQ